MALSKSNLWFSVEQVPLGVEDKDKARFPGGSGAIARGAECVRVGPYLYLTAQDNKDRRFHTMLNVKTRRWKSMRCKGLIPNGRAAFLYQDSMLSLHGRGFVFSESGRLSRFDFALNAWSIEDTVGEKPGPRSYFSGDFLEKLNLYVVFGGGPDSLSVRLLDLPERRWAKAISSGIPAQSRPTLRSCVHNGLIYKYGGCNENWGDNGELFILKVESGRRVTWSSPRTNVRAIEPLFSFVFIPVGRIQLICGGRTLNGSHGLSYYDTDLREFRKVELRPETRDCFAAEILVTAHQNEATMIQFSTSSCQQKFNE